VDQVTLNDATELKGSRLTHWHQVRPFIRNRLPLELRDWMLDPGSLTQNLIQYCPGPFQVELQMQGFAIPRFNERKSLKLTKKTYCLIRQVVLLCGNIPMIFARTVIPLSTLTGKERKLAKMGNQSLGAALFADRTMRRDQMEIASISPKQFFYQQACKSLSQRPDKIWGRRSVFICIKKNY